ncbi:hypothetical protein EK21DRAFT_72421 [Setomelanomma holmii]|uniref:RED-like N-terminal domain-containing protein n=1 Tax=Setomelanomma holmii TaxID=210430 RepID=A0A9P4H3D5_9PLEO|nr:hypothetical protein EK21DRAFT_72421 [Setomelanomma holmii]
MNNQQFRRLLLSDTPRKDGEKGTLPAAGTPKAVLGARKHSSIPMTPRHVGKGSVQADFARQVAERNAKANPQRQGRSSAPKGTKLAAGYTDRTKERADPEDNETAKRIKNLEESMKLGQIDRETFEHLVQEITGGDVGTTHLVKGLDRKLLERVRRGENVLEDNGEKEQEEEDISPAVEDAFEELANEEISSITREKAEKKGEKIISPPPPVAGVKRSRNDILKDLKRQREEAAADAAVEHEKKFPSLGPGFRKINAQGETSCIEVDEKGREVLIITGLDGKEKRKIRKQKSEGQPALEVRHDLDDTAKPINMQNLPEPKREESDDDDIFEGVGSNYNPLVDLDGGSDDPEQEEETPVQKNEVVSRDAQEAPTEPAATSHISDKVNIEVSRPTVPAKRDYFKITGRDTATGPSANFSSADATVRAALAKVRNLDESSALLQNLSSADPNDPNSKEARLKKRAAELAASDRDLEDMDLGFGASRFDDADDMEREGEKVKFSQWKGLGTEDDGEDGEDGTRDAKKQRKRGPKKKRGDKNKAEDVLKVMERQKEKKTLG